MMRNNDDVMAMKYRRLAMRLLRSGRTVEAVRVRRGADELARLHRLFVELGIIKDNMYS